MDPEFQRALVIVLVAGTLVMGAGTALLYFAFRSFGGKKHPALIGGLVAFVLACCVALFFLSYR